jgi:hypothetical protein
MIMQRLILCLVVAIGGVAVWETHPLAQAGRRANWLTDGGDAQRTSWQRNEKLISLATVKDMRLLWTLKLDNQQREMHNLFAPLIIGDLQMAGGAREIAVVAGISDNVYGIDVESGKQLWKRHFDSTFDDNGRSGGPLCPVGRRHARSRSRPIHQASTSCTRFRGTGGSVRSIRQPARRSRGPSRSCLRMASLRAEHL